MAKKNQAAFKFQKFSRKQKQVLTWWRDGSPFNDYDGIIADGSIRSGKTIAFIIGFILWSIACFTGENFIISSKSMGALKRNIIGPMIRILRALGIAFTYNRSENYLLFGGNTYHLFGANNEASQDVLQGFTAAGFLSDETALQPRSFTEQAIGRCSVDGAKLWFNCNPANPKHYVKTDLIDAAKEKHLLHLFFNLDDNLTLSPRTKDRYKRMFSGVWFKRMILGLWCAAEGAVYDMFDDTKHVVDDLPEMVQYWIGGDYGSTNPTVFVLIGMDAHQRYYVCREWRYDKNNATNTDPMTSPKFVGALKQFILDAGVFPSMIYFDPSAADFINQLKLAGITNVKGANNDVVGGIRTIGGLIGEGRFFIHRSCIHTIREFFSYVWNSKATERGEDKPVKLNDHNLDAVRYVINMVVRKATSISSWT